eukprot:701886-Hanusia_phi.AAC.1
MVNRNSAYPPNPEEMLESIASCAAETRPSRAPDHKFWMILAELSTLDQMLYESMTCDLIRKVLLRCREQQEIQSSILPRYFDSAQQNCSYSRLEATD